VTLAYLELMPPDLQQAGQALVAAGCRGVTVLPLFLGAGGHVRKDLPAQLELLRKAHPAVQWHLEPAAGESELLIEALVAIATESTDKSAQSSTGDDQEPA
jgi:sirohydrochlorin cobaltochelatase